jgi:hypothetical protein
MSNPSSNNYTPWKTLIFLIAVAALIGLGTLLGMDGTAVGSYSLRYPTAEDFKTIRGRTVDMDQLLEDYHEIDLMDDTVILQLDTLPATVDTSSIQDKDTVFAPPLRDIQFASMEGNHPLNEFYQSLYNSAYLNKRIRILHYGDSQIEGDRITSKVRHTLQYYFSGSGSGWHSMTPLVPSFSMVVESSRQWERYPGFGRKDTSIAHNNYGPLISLSKYSQSDSTDFPKLVIQPRSYAFSTAKKFTTLTFHHSKLLTPIDVFVSQKDTVNDTIHLNMGDSVFQIAVSQPAGKITLEFDGESPDWYGFHADNETGITIDNIPLRGSSGTFFTKLPMGEPEKYFSDETVGLIILQFGGNTVPYIESKEHAKRYGRWIQRNISHLKKRFPNANFLFIGPSDMALKERTQMVTYPFLNDVRLAVKQAAFDENIAFWDIYEAMGGENSIASWVENDPPLASPDYVHFSPRGAALIGQWLSEAIITDYELWKMKKEDGNVENP